jgi:hypothetical protein
MLIARGSIDIAALIPNGMRIYGQACGWTLARARSGDRIAIALTSAAPAFSTRPSPSS